MSTTRRVNCVCDVCSSRGFEYIYMNHSSNRHRNVYLCLLMSITNNYCTFPLHSRLWILETIRRLLTDSALITPYLLPVWNLYKETIFYNKLSLWFHSLLVSEQVSNRNWTLLSSYEPVSRFYWFSICSSVSVCFSLEMLYQPFHFHR